jgi:archaellum biogenesis ATPase FlaH
VQNFDPVLETRVLKTVMDCREINLFGLLGQDYFGHPGTREIWERLTLLKSAGKTFPTSQTFATDPVLTDNARQLLQGPLPAYQDYELESALDQLNRYRRNRHYFWMISRVADICKEQNPNHDEAQKAIEECLRSVQNPATEEELLSYGAQNDKVLDLYEKLMAQPAEEYFIPTGYKVIDRQQGGVSRGRIYAMAANSGGGKSLLCNSIAVNAYRAGFSVGYVSLELGQPECLFRTQTNISRIPHDRFQKKTLSEKDRLRSDQMLAEFLAWGESKGIRLDYITPRRDLNIVQILGQMENLNYDLIVFDYINLAAYLNPKEGLWWNIGEGFRFAKRFAERNRCAILLPVQIDKETGTIKYARSIEHHSDGIWTWTCGKKEIEMGVVQVDQPKFRNFAPMSFTLKPEFEFATFSESYGDGAPPPKEDHFKAMKL